MIVAKVLAGAFFLIIIILNVVSERFGYQTFSETDGAKQLEKINGNQRYFRINRVLMILEHAAVVIVAVLLFVAFRDQNLLLALICVVFRAAEGLIQLYYKKEYWHLSGMAARYASASDKTKTTLAEETRKILERKNTVFTFCQILFGAGTLAYSILFVMYDVLPPYISWFGVAAAALYGVGSGIKLSSIGSQAVWNIGGLLILVYESVLGGWLIINTLITM